MRQAKRAGAAFFWLFLFFFFGLLQIAAQANDIARSAFDFVVDRGQIKADQSHAQQNAAADQQKKENDRCEALHRRSGDPAPEGLDPQKETGDDGAGAEIGNDAQRNGAEGNDVGKRVFDQLPEGPFGFPDHSVRHVIVNAAAFESRPEGQGSEEGAPFRHLEKNVGHLFVDQLEVAGVLQVKAGQGGKDPVKEPGELFMQGGFLAAAFFQPLHDLIALLPELIHFGDLLRRVLQVAVHHDKTIAAPPGKPGQDRGLLAEITAEFDALYPGILFRRLFDGGKGLIPGTVADKKQLAGDPAAVHQLQHDLRRIADIALLVEGGDHDCQ